ncbi:MAG: ribosomal L7Ae/L30e/S12e/Gadd45 family protein [Bacillota bacterium]
MPRKDRVAGVRSTERAVQTLSARKVLVAKDAEERVTKRIVLLCKEKGVEVGFVPSMKELGESCGLRVGASCCAVLSPPE